MSIAIGVVLLIVRAAIATDPVTSSAEIQRRLFDKNLVVVTRSQQIPVSVIRQFASLTRTQGVVFAEPGAKFQATDVISEGGLPWRRLIFAGIATNFCIINYEKGGYGHSENVVVFQLAPSGATLMWRAVLDKRAADLAQLQQAVRNGAYRDDPAYSF